MSLKINHIVLAIILIFSSAIVFAQTNIVVNGDFESGLSQWSYWFDTSNGYNGSFQTTNTQVYN